MTVEESVILKYEQTLSVCTAGQVCRGGGGERGRRGESLQASPCVCWEGLLLLSLWLGKPYLQKHREKGLLAQQ